jgi:hypothetical protein
MHVFSPAHPQPYAVAVSIATHTVENTDVNLVPRQVAAVFVTPQFGHRCTLKKQAYDAKKPNRRQA